MRLFHTSAALALLASAYAGVAFADAPKTTPANDPVVATVNKDAIHLSDVNAAISQLPPNVLQSTPPDEVYSKMLDNMVSKRAVLIEARKSKVDSDPEVKKHIADQVDNLLMQAYIMHALKDQVSEEAVKAVYDRDYAHKPGEPQVHARHILVDSEAKARDIIKQLDGGAKFEDLAKKYGDPKDGATQNGGDLGWFGKTDMIPEFSEAAFKLKKNEITKDPVHTHYGWHVIQVLDTRVAPPPSYDAVAQEIKQKLMQEGVKAEVQKAREAVKIAEYQKDGKTPIKPDATTPAPAAAAAPATKK